MNRLTSVRVTSFVFTAFAEIRIAQPGFTLYSASCHVRFVNLHDGRWLCVSELRLIKFV